jgi:hypothetical protein
LRVQSLVFLGNTISLQLTAGALEGMAPGKKHAIRSLEQDWMRLFPDFLKWKSSIVESLNAHKI